MKFTNLIVKLAVVAALLLPINVFAQEKPGIPQEVLEQLEAAGYESNPEVFKQLTTGGRPMGRWKEGLITYSAPWADGYLSLC